MAWHSGTFWLRDLREIPADEIDQARKTKDDTIAIDTIYRVAAAAAPYADHGTGRSVTVAHKTLAAQLGVHIRTIGRAWRVLDKLKLAQTLLTGRYLTAAERALIKARYGRHQIKRASTRALTARRRAVYQLRSSQERPKSSLTEMVKHQRARARGSLDQAAEAKTSPGRHTFTPWPADLYRFAVELSTRLPWLARQHHPASVCAMLNRAGITPDRWTAATLLDAIAAGNQRAGMTVQDGHRQHNPIAYMAWLIKTTIDLDSPTLLEQHRARWAAHEQARREQAAAAAAEVARVARIRAEDNGASARFFEEDKKRYGRKPGRTRLNIEGAQVALTRTDTIPG
ncbi:MULTISPECIES: hypothetical protein [Cryobacterium]|uniref:Replication protein n=1 Tax=Cryobacterium breve TaxID=1259258 RepID=A0ABY2J1R3_9MICO|nr:MULTISPECIES: hypothetical protein [Cryobacterium]TFC93009.1 hypothetical protein E3T20_11160 [Cryobacterium sp. TmT3-12]TFC98874.1 hypothetical protein E3O65_06975 [Cryobacterium breve]